ncbi:MAG: 2-oxo acid dehydrogenase subunit E2 [Oscillospiraceae bacterium]|nr:2-oxo acid dehydrogenase subunit E2 [Oscillospiraceae bacterium]MBQ9331949.1 2-oxo acid dehydrogenase subunit E2 [Oscillospiraceae bacterium]
MAKVVVMPKLGLTMTEGTVSKWLKKVGDAVSEGEPLFEVETDKLTNTIEASASGVLRHLFVEEGVTVPVLEKVAVIAAADEDIAGLLGGAAPAPAAAAAPTPAAAPAASPAEKKAGGRVIASPAAKKLAKEKGIDLTLVTGTGPNGRITEDDVKNYTPAPAAPAAPAAEEVPKVKASPLAAAVAADLGLDLEKIGAKDRVLAEDILRYLESTREKAEEAPKEELVPMNGMRKAIAKNMLNSHMTSPTVTANLSVDMSAMKAYREQLKAKEIKVSYTDLLVKFVAKALTEYPLLNCSVEDNKIRYKHYVNMGVAVALDNGLVVPNVTDADKKSLTEISAEIKELAKLAREGGLPMEKLRGGTFTITNLGMYGIESFTPIINQPEVAILGVTTMEDRAVVRGGEIVIRPMMTLSLTFDHRVVDGSVAAEFLQRVKNLLENPALMLA